MKKLSMTRMRHYVLLAILCVVLAGLIARMVALQVFDKQFLTSQGEARTTRTLIQAPHRGMITDRNGEPLAISTRVHSIWVNPKEFDAEHKATAKLAQSLGVNVKQLKSRIRSFQDKEFLYLKRHVSPDLAQTIQRLHVPGIHLRPEYRRFYPLGEISAHILGFTNIDGAGQEGLELKYDTWLKGSPGRKRIIRDRQGRQVEYAEALKDMQPGENLTLSVDQRLQYLAYRELKEAVSNHQASGGTAIILDVQSGEVLSMVNQPSFNPNQRIKQRTDSFRNRAVTDTFEPGSVMKTFALLSAMERGQVKATSLVDTSPGWISLNGKKVKDERNHGIIDVMTLMRRSSNVGISKLTLAAPPQALFDTYRKLGFGQQTAIDFPGESSGVLNCPHANSQFVLATMSFGYGLSVTPLQLAQAYAILGGQGIKRPIQFLKQAANKKTEQIVKPKVASQVLDILQAVAEQNGSNAKVLGYQVAGKTGTSRKISKHGYSAKEHIAVFAGLVPAKKPRFSIVIVIDGPTKGGYYGNAVAAPVFSAIASAALRIYNIAPEVDSHPSLQLAAGL